jgi:hypothetical protein
MKKIILIAVASLLLASCARDFVKSGKNRFIEKFPGLAEQEYVPGIEDMPVYHSFKKQEGSLISYDTTDGRIINAEYHSKEASASDVKLFYEATLPQLGWSIVEPETYQRDGETLELDISERNGNTAIKFTIRPSIS